MFKIIKYLPFALVCAVLIQTGCTQQQSDQSANNQAQQFTDTNPDVAHMVAVVYPTEGNNVTGTVTFEKADNGVRVHAEIQGLEDGQHGFHVHEYGDCTASDGTSAGGHYNPADANHGAPTDQNRHMGDMGNIVANAQGMASLDYIDENIQLSGSNSILGRAIVIHGGEDDLSSQPSGDAGPRIACGVIGIANTEQ